MRKVEITFDEKMASAISAHGASTQAALWRLQCYGIDSGYVDTVKIYASDADQIDASYWRPDGTCACTLHAVWTMAREMEVTEAMRKGDFYSPLGGWMTHQ